MKTKIYLILHGESQGNIKSVFLGHGDLDLTERGYAQAQKTAEYLKNIPVDAIYSSDLLRAYNTAKATAEKFGLPIVARMELREINAGKWEFVNFTTISEKFSDTYGVWLTNIGRSCPDGGESVANLQKRIAGEITRICEENLGKTVCVFTHATSIRVFAAFCEGKSLDGIKERPFPTNASVTSVEYEDGKFKLVEYSHDSFMGELKNNLPNNV